MRICLVNLRALPVLAEEFKLEHVGGEEVQHALLAKALVAMGHEVRLVVADFGQPDGAEYEGVVTLKAFKESAGFTRYRDLWTALDRANADVYYYSCAGPMLGIIAAYCANHNKRLVYRVARDDDCTPEVAIKWAHDRWLYRAGLKRADAILVQTESQQQALFETYGLTSKIAGMLVEQPAHITLKPGDDINAALASVAKNIDVLWVANIKPEKRPEMLIELANVLPHVNFHMVGAKMPGHEDLYFKIVRWAVACPNVIFHGGVPYRDIGRLFDRAKLFVNTSELEGFPNTYLQAWVRGIPVIATFDPGGVIDREGLGVARDMTPSLAWHIDELLAPTQHDCYQRLRASVVAFMFDKTPAKVMEPYLQALHGKPPAYDWLDDDRALLPGDRA